MYNKNEIIYKITQYNEMCNVKLYNILNFEKILVSCFVRYTTLYLINIFLLKNTFINITNK